MNDIFDILEVFPINESRQDDLIKISKDINYRALMLNNLLACLNSPATSEFDAVCKYSAAREAAKALMIKPKKIEEKQQPIKK